MRPNVHISNKEEGDICGTMVRAAQKRAKVAANYMYASNATADPTIGEDGARCARQGQPQAQ